MAQYRSELIDTGPATGDYPDEVKQALEWATDEVLRLDTENIGLKSELWKLTQENDYMRERLRFYGERIPTREETSEAYSDWSDEPTPSFS